MSQENRPLSELIQKRLDAFRPLADPPKTDEEHQELDRRETRVRLEAALGRPSPIKALRPRPASARGNSLPTKSGIATLLDGFREGAAKPPCIEPFSYAGVNLYHEIDGPAPDQVTRGMVGVAALDEDVYTVRNMGTEKGKTRHHVRGIIEFLFLAKAPAAGKWIALLPHGELHIDGWTRVVGQGNRTTSYDAKVWVTLVQTLALESGTLIEQAITDVCYDGTRSEDRTKDFRKKLILEPRYVPFTVNRSDSISYSFLLDIDTAANEDGLAFAHVETFGFYSNWPNGGEYETLIARLF